MMGHKVNIAIQILPTVKDKHPYEVIDKAIEVIRNSGVKFCVCPFETVMEGEYEELLMVVKQAQLACFEAGAEQVLTNLKIQIALDKDVTIDEKMGKYVK
jgi:uncharacterized protein YqgV (UPF0045/DUF77 family)